MVDFSWATLSLSNEPPLLLLGQTPTASKVPADRVKIDPNMERELRSISEVSVTRLREFQQIKYSETQDLEEDQYFSGDLYKILSLEKTDETTEGPGVPSLESSIQSSRSQPQMLTLADLESHVYAFYVVVLRDIEGNNVSFVKRQFGFQVAKRNGFLARHVEMLKKIEEPVFKIANEFDFVISGNNVAVFNPRNFLALFVDVDALKKAVPAYTSAVQEQVSLPINTEALGGLTALGVESPRVAQQLRRISRVDYLHRVTRESLEKYLQEAGDDLHHGLSFDPQGNLQFDDQVSSAKYFLNLLEQRYWRGNFDNRWKAAQGFKNET